MRSKKYLQAVGEIYNMRYFLKKIHRKYKVTEGRSNLDNVPYIEILRHHSYCNSITKELRYGANFEMECSCLEILWSPERIVELKFEMIIGLRDLYNKIELREMSKSDDWEHDYSEYDIGSGLWVEELYKHESTSEEIGYEEVERWYFKKREGKVYSRFVASPNSLLVELWRWPSEIHKGYSEVARWEEEDVARREEVWRTGEKEWKIIGLWRYYMKKKKGIKIEELWEKYEAIYRELNNDGRRLMRYEDLEESKMWVEKAKEIVIKYPHVLEDVEKQLKEWDWEKESIEEDEWKNRWNNN